MVVDRGDIGAMENSCVPNEGDVNNGIVSRFCNNASSITAFFVPF